MKKLMIGILLSGGLTTVCADIDVRKAEQALENGDVMLAKRVLKKLNRQELPVEKKRALLEGLQDKVTDVIQERTSSMRYYKNRWDTAKVITGWWLCVFTLYGITMAQTDAEHSKKKKNDPNFDVNRAIWTRRLLYSTLVGLPGIYSLYRGFMCSAQKAQLNKFEVLKSDIEHQLEQY